MCEGSLLTKAWYRALDLGTRFQKQLEWLKSFQHATREEIYSFQLNTIRDLLNHCYRNVPFYRKSWRSSGFNPDRFRELELLENVPVTTRADLRLHFPSGTCAHNVSVLRRVRKSTSGSTGQPLEFYNDRWSLGIRLASRFLHNEWVGIELLDSWIRMTHPQARYRSLVNETQISTLAATRHRVRELVQYLENARPKGIVAFPSALRILSEGLDSHNDGFPSTLKAVVSTGEMLLPLDRTRMSRTFGVEVYDRYSTQEVPGEWAQQCVSRNELHWNPAIVFLEIRYKEREARAGETGRVLLTDLWNRAMPLVRYEIGESDGRYWLQLRAKLGNNCRPNPPITGLLDSKEWRTYATRRVRLHDSQGIRSRACSLPVP
jgi:phenylacetate-CoA ligase